MDKYIIKEVKYTKLEIKLLGEIYHKSCEIDYLRTLLEKHNIKTI